jgi:hypothetical protein
MMIKARLTGHEADLITLGELFREGDPVVAADQEGHYLGFVAPDQLIDNGARLYEFASSLLLHVNGVGRLRSSEFRPVRLTGRFDDDAGRQHAVVLAETAEVRAFALPVTVLINGQQAPAPLPPGPRYVQLAATNSDVAEVLRILGNAGQEPAW